MTILINHKEVDIGSISVDGVDPRDYPDFSDAYIEYATFTDGTPLTEDELIELGDEYPDLIGEIAFDSCVGMADYNPYDD